MGTTYWIVELYVGRGPVCSVLTCSQEQVVSERACTHQPGDVELQTRAMSADKDSVVHGIAVNLLDTSRWRCTQKRQQAKRTCVG